MSNKKLNYMYFFSTKQHDSHFLRGNNKVLKCCQENVLLGNIEFYAPHKCPYNQHISVHAYSSKSLTWIGHTVPLISFSLSAKTN